MSVSLEITFGVEITAAPMFVQVVLVKVRLDRVIATRLYGWHDGKHYATCKEQCEYFPENAL